MSVDFKTFVSLAPSVSAAKLPVLLRGRHGIGKSQVVYQLAANAGLPVVERRASQMTEGDLVGLPSVEGNRTSFNPPDWFKQACEEPVCLFLDEVDRATLEVRQGIFELTDSRKLNGHNLHPDTIIFAAVNGGEHGENYQVNEMDPAELDRWSSGTSSRRLKIGSPGLRTMLMASSGTSSTRTVVTSNTMRISNLTNATPAVVAGTGLTKFSSRQMLLKLVQ